MKNMETEFKWDANSPRAFMRMLAAVRRAAGKENVSSPRRLKIEDVYLERPGGEFEKRLIAFRVRNTDGKWEAAFKTRTEVKNGKAVRREETMPLANIKNLADALEFLNAKKRWKVLDITGLRPVFSIRNRRRTAEVFYDGAKAELALDDCEILVLGRRVCMKEIELELKQGSAEKMERLAREMTRGSGLEYARVSKVKTAAALLKLWGNK